MVIRYTRRAAVMLGRCMIGRDGGESRSTWLHRR
jgi:hypothetical protein